MKECGRSQTAPQPFGCASRFYRLQQCFVERGRAGDLAYNFRLLLHVMVQEPDELVPRALKEMIDHAVYCSIANIRETNGGFIVMRAGLERPMEKALEVEPVHDGHHRGVCKRTECMNC